MDRRLAKEPLRHPAPARRRTRDRAPAEHRCAASRCRTPRSCGRRSSATSAFRARWARDGRSRRIAAAGSSRSTRPTRSGRFSFDLPVEYGENADGLRRVRALRRGAAVQPELSGERRRHSRTNGRVRARGRRLPHRRLPGQREPRPALRRLPRRWTVRGGVDQFWRDSLPGLFHPYLGAGRLDRQRLGAWRSKPWRPPWCAARCATSRRRTSGSAPSTTTSRRASRRHCSRRSAGARSGPPSCWRGRCAATTTSISRAASTASPRRTARPPAGVSVSRSTPRGSASRRPSAT